MALQRQPWLLPIAQNMDTKSDAKMLTGGLTTVKNAVHDKEGRLSLRNGLEHVPNTNDQSDTISTWHAVQAYKDELLGIWNNRLYTFNDYQDKWIYRGPIYTVMTEARLSYNRFSGGRSADSAVLQGSILLAFRDYDGSLRYQLYDQQTNGVIKSDSQIAAAASILRCVTFSGFYFVFYSANNNLYGAKINPATGAIASTVTITSTLSSTDEPWDVVEVSGDGIMLLSYYDSGGSIKNLSLNVNMAITKTTTIAEAASVIALIPYTASITLCAYRSTTNVRYFVIAANNTPGAAADTGLSSTLSGVNNVVSIAGHATGSTFIKIYCHYSDPDPYDEVFIKFARIPMSTGSITTGDFVGSVELISRGFVHNGVGYLVTAHFTELQSTFFLIDENGVIAGKAQVGTAGKSSFASQLSSVWSLSSGVFEFASLITTRLVSLGSAVEYYRYDNGSNNFSNFFSVKNPSIISFNFSNTNFNAVESQGSLLIAGSVVSQYDGVSIVEHNFHLFPELRPETLLNVGTGNLAPGTYLYTAVYEWVDAAGIIHQSAPAVPRSVTVGSASNVLLPSSTLRLTAKTGSRREAGIAFYRTKVNQSNVFYRVSSSITPTPNSTTAAVLSLIDNVSDSVLGSREILYISGGVLDNQAAYPTRFLATFKDRIIAVLSERNQIQYSKPLQDGRPVEFSAELTKQIPEIGGKATGIADLDQQFVVFKKEQGFFYGGDGLDATGLGNDFTEGSRSFKDVGCISHLSICGFPGGIIFKSVKGWFVADFAGQLVPMLAVEAYNGLTVRSATIVPTMNEIRIIHSDGEALVFNYQSARWSVFDGYQGNDATMWLGKFVLVKSPSIVAIEQPSLYRDNNVSVSMEIESGWISLGQIGGFQRIFELAITGEYRSQHTLELSVAYDHSSTYSEVWSWSAVSAAPYIFRQQTTRQRCSAIRIKIRIIPDGTGTGQGAYINAVLFLVGIVPGLARVDRTRRNA